MKRTIHWEFSVLSITIVETMARLSCVALIIAMNVLMCVLAEEKLYNDRYDDTNFEYIMCNDKERDEYYNCFMEKAKCKTEVQKFFTGKFSEAYQTNCKKCTEKQKKWLKIVCEWYKEHDLDTWRLIVAKTEEDMKKKAVVSKTANTDG